VGGADARDVGAATVDSMIAPIIVIEIRNSIDGIDRDREEMIDFC
jgi:hypothetical protein